MPRGGSWSTTQGAGFGAEAARFASSDYNKYPAVMLLFFHQIQHKYDMRHKEGDAGHGLRLHFDEIYRSATKHQLMCLFLFFLS